LKDFRHARRTTFPQKWQQHLTYYKNVSRTLH